MPIRLLAFDKNGSSIRLIGRDEILERILPDVFAKIAEPEFQSAWAKATALKDSEFMVLSAKHRENKTRELLKAVVEQSVHYSILSHTWMRETLYGDVTFQDWDKRERNPRGNAKIIKFCKVSAQNHKIALGWIDTVCINKHSSSELDESIRSMYNWYQRAAVCVTYLSETTNISDAQFDSWFTRGWTLQELLAPARSVFYNKTWDQLGTSSDSRIQSVIKKASGITSQELKLSWSGNVHLIPFSRRMQMACGRQVTREEDTSYSLMGILGVNMSIAYGEGASRAFFRLVHELFDTKENVMDLFNRSYNYGENLLPSSLESYRYRSDWWDNSNWPGGTHLNRYPPFDPIISTHLGMRIPLLLAPALVTKLTNDEDYLPKGDVFATQTTTYFLDTGAREEARILLLDSRLYAGDLSSLRVISPGALLDEIPVRMVGIVNFGVDSNGRILLPEQCLALRLYWDKLEKGSFTPSGKVQIRSGQPYSFKLEFKNGKSEMPKAELEEHGMQFVSLYL